jgi:hypothetical protein
MSCKCYSIRFFNASSRGRDRLSKASRSAPALTRAGCSRLFYNKIDKLEAAALEAQEGED